ncbi:aconitase X catalytic domain-containing protein [Methanolapillus millepedarum]|uniref:Phosphomevalonate dehydratase large subunit n=1 Tax=Methanolapillus millepedarum TaxID=3028296 RepID=A0AA96ZTG7_9EURY|nr:hypothetical protein MsAc7_00360 [Methanosarcinaceae archaeon Ac7]
MYLTKEEERTLRGDNGETLQKAIEILVALGDIYGADQLIPIKSAQVSGVSYKTIGDAGLEWISDLNGKVKVPTVLNPAGMDLQNWERINIDHQFAKKQLEIIQAFKNLGIESKCTCTPYYLDGFDVQYKDHLAWGESSAISYANSVLGARTNREGGPSALSAALVGKTADFGFHKPENRVPNIDISVDFDLTGSDFGALGFVAGKLVGNKIPIFHLTKAPAKDEMKMLGAAMAASGAVALYHIDGVTPETLDKNISFERPIERVSIEKSQIDSVYASANSSVRPDIVTVGCPHCSVAELSEIARLVAGKSVVKEFWVFTSREVANKNPNLVAQIEKSGAKVVCDTCMVVSPAGDKYSCMMVNSGKAYAYVPGMCGMKSVFGTVERCVKEALGES